MDHITYTRFDPTSKDDALVAVQSMFPTIASFSLTLLAAGTGIGKTRMLRFLADYWYVTYGSASIVYLLPPSKMIGDQLLSEFAAYTILNTDEFKTSGALEKATMRALGEGKKVIVCCNSVKHTNGNFTQAAERALTMMEHMQKSGRRQLALIDELHSVLTTLVGGMNARPNHAKDDMKHYEKIRVQNESYLSLNTFDKFKEYGVHVVAGSATLNNVICSKLSTIAYEPRDMQIINLFPIKSLYKDLRCIPVETHEFGVIAPHIEAAETVNGKILLIFSCNKDIAVFHEQYRRRFGRPILSYVEVTAKTNLDLLDTNIAGAKYVIGINLLGTGFDIATHAKGTKFILGILFRKFSDKASQPLSNNPLHPLHVEMSAQLAQALGRLRTGGIFLIPSHFGPISMYGLQHSVSQAIHDGYKEYATYCRPETLQPRRYIQGIMIALLQNLRFRKDGESLDDLPVIDGVLTDLFSLTRRNFKKEATAPHFPSHFWTRSLSILYEIYYMEYRVVADYEERVKVLGAATVGEAPVVRHEDEIARRRSLIRSGGGYREGRLRNDLITAEVRERARGICGHCGLPEGPDMQVCHIKAHAKGGPLDPDNLIWGHRGCDGIFDAADLILDPHGGFWRHSRINFAPDAYQLKWISPIYIEARWAQHKETLCISGNVREWLTHSGYVYCH